MFFSTFRQTIIIKSRFVFIIVILKEKMLLKEVHLTLWHTLHFSAEIITPHVDNCKSKICKRDSNLTGYILLNNLCILLTFKLKYSD